MKRIATALCGILALTMLALPAEAQDRSGDIQDVTVRQINTIPQANIDQLIALGASATAAQIHELLDNDWIGVPVRVEAVVLTDPRYSGLSSVGGENIPNRVHFFVRDVDAETDGVEGMTIQVVDDTQTGQSLPLRPGDIVEIEGFVNAFGNPPQRTWQLQPLDGESILPKGSVSPEAEWLQPVVVTTAEVNMVVAVAEGEPLVQANWANFNDLHGQYVRIEDAQITNSDQNETIQRPNWAFSTIGEDARIASYDLSLRYRNDRAGVYPNPPFFTRPADDPFIVPPAGAIVNVQGFLTFGVFDAFNIGQPPRAFWYISPITDDDLEISESPPIINVEPLTFVPDGPIDVSATVVPASGAPITSVTLHYDFVGGTSGEVTMSEGDGEDEYVGTIPVTAAQDGQFLNFYVAAEDGLGLTNESTTQRTRVLMGGITQIAHIQETALGGQGPSPFAGLTLSMDLDVIVMTEVSDSGIITIQDGTEPWSGVHVFRSGELEALLVRGMTLNITEAQIQESFGMTRLQIPTGGFTVTGADDPYPYVVLSTADVASPNDAEKYEGMALRFNNVVITSENPDAPSNFGEWAFSSDGTTANQIRGDDESPEIPFGSDMFDVGDMVEYIQGVWAFTFSNYKLWPETMADIGKVTVSSDDGATGIATSLDAVYPNPLVRQGTVAYVLAQDGPVTVEVFDVTGRRVAVLADGVQAAGRQELTVSTAGLASGMYIVRLLAGDQVHTTRFVVAR